MGFRATTSSSLDSSRGGLRGGSASRRVARGIDTRPAPPEDRYDKRRANDEAGTAAAAFCVLRGGDGMVVARRHGAAQWSGSHNR